MVEMFVEPTDDATVDSVTPSANYGSVSNGIVTYTPPNIRWMASFFKFNIPNINIDQVFLRVYVLPHGNQRNGEIMINDWPNYTWSEDTITYNTRPTEAGILSVPYAYGGGDSYWTNIDITDFVKAHKGETITLGMIPITDHVFMQFSLKEGANKPNLRIIYTEVPPDQAVAHFRSSPSGATIVIDENPIGQVTPYDYSIAEAIDSEIRYILVGYETSIFQAVVALGQDIYFHKDLTPTEVPPDKGYIRGKVTHSLLGTPLALVGIDWGSYSTESDANGDYVLEITAGFTQPITAIFPGFENYSTPIAAGPGDDITHNIELVPVEVPPEKGTVQLNSIPQGAKMFIDGVDTGEFGPYVYTAAPGTYLIRMELDGYETREGTLNLTVGSNPPFTLTLPLIGIEPWWERITEFDDEGNLVFTDELVSVHNLQPWLEANYLEKPLTVAAKVAFLTVLAAASAGALFKIWAALHPVVAAELIFEAKRELPNWADDTATATAELVRTVARDQARLTEWTTESLKNFALQVYTTTPWETKVLPVLTKPAIVQPAATAVINTVGPVVGKAVAAAAARPGIWAIIPTTWKGWMGLVAASLTLGFGVDWLAKEGPWEAAAIPLTDAIRDDNWELAAKQLPVARRGLDWYKTAVFTVGLLNPISTPFFIASLNTAEDEMTLWREQILANIAPAELPEDWFNEWPEDVAPEIGSAWVMIQSNPQGAGIYVDGDYKFIKTNFQFLLVARDRPYFIQISAPSGYRNPTGSSITVVKDVNQLVDFGDLTPLAPGETPEPFIPTPIEVPIVPIEPPEVIYTAWKYTITARDSETGNIVGAKIIINGNYTGKYTTNSIILEPNATYKLRLEAFGYEPAELDIVTGALP